MLRAVGSVQGSGLMIRTGAQHGQHKGLRSDPGADPFSPPCVRAASGWEGFDDKYTLQQ